MKVWTYSSGSGQGPVACCYKHEHGTLVGREFPVQVRDSHLLKKDSSSWS